MAASSVVVVRRLSDVARLPMRGTDGAAGYDLATAEDVVLMPGRGAPRSLRTDIAIERMPPDVYDRIATRSSLSLRHGVEVGASVIDPDYRGAIHVLLYNHGTDPVTFVKGDRIAQLVFERFITPLIVDAADGRVSFSVAPQRGTGAFGSTGLASSPALPESNNHNTSLA